MRIIFISLLLGLSASPVFALPDIQCNPEADCTMDVWVMWQKVGTAQNPGCVTAKALCRTKCNNLNNDANRYIREDNDDIARLAVDIQQNENQQVAIDQLITGNHEILERQASLCLEVANSRNEYLHDISLQKILVSELSELISLKLTSDEKQKAIDSNQSYSPREKLVLKSFIQSAINSTMDLKMLVDEFRTEIYGNFDRIMSHSIDVSMKDCETQKTGMLIQSQTLKNQKASLMVIKNRLLLERNAKVAHIREQENRKCR